MDFSSLSRKLYFANGLLFFWKEATYYVKGIFKRYSEICVLDWAHSLRLKALSHSPPVLLGLKLYKKYSILKQAQSYFLYPNMITCLKFKKSSMQVVCLSHPISFHISVHVDRLCHNTSAERSAQKNKISSPDSKRKTDFRY